MCYPRLYAMERARRTGCVRGAMANEPDYYQLLGVEPTADQATIDAAYQGRSLRFRLGQLRDRAQAMSGPSREEIEQAHAVLGNPEARALYDVAYFPDKVSRGRRRMPLWVWAVATAWFVVIATVCVIGARSKLVDDGGAIGRVVATVTATPPPVIAVASPPIATAAAPTATPQPSAPAPTGAVPAVATASAPALPTPTATLSTPSLTFRPTPTETPAPAPTATATALPSPSAVALPTTTPMPPPPTEPPPPPPTEAPPAPTPAPAFPATDRIGTAVPVNLRSGPGTNFATLGALSPGTLLAATGETANAGGYLWRRFRLQDGRLGWVRDLDVTTVR